MAKTLDVSNFCLPIEVWRAVEGDCSELIALLRSEQPLSQPTRAALADWLEETLKPVKLPRGRPKREMRRYEELANAKLLTYGYDMRTVKGRAAIQYHHCWSYIKKRGWHKKEAGKLQRHMSDIREKIAHKFGLDPQAFDNFLNRSRTKLRRLEVTEHLRHEIAMQVRSAKMRESR